MACFDLDEDLRTNPLWVRSYDVPTPGTRVYGSSMEFSPTGNFVLSVERYVYSDGGSTTLSRWRSAADGASVGDGIILQPSTTSVRLSCDATRFFTLNGNSLHSYDATGTSAAFERVSSGNRKHFTDIAVHPDGRRVIATCNEATVREFDAVTLRELRAYDWKAGRLRCVAIAPDGLTAAAGSDTGKVVVWDLE